MNNKWKLSWKEHSRNKRANVQDHVVYCFIKALNAKGENKKEIALALLRRAFTPRAKSSYSTLHRAIAILHSRLLYGLSWPSWDCKEFLLEEEKEALLSLVKEINNVDVMKTVPKYLFTFVRQDIPKEQQMVQASHATYAAGAKFQPDDAHKTNFVIVGVPSIHDLVLVKELLKSHRKDYVEFYEPDNGYGLTSITSEPMYQFEKQFLKRYKTLKFE